MAAATAGRCSHYPWSDSGGPAAPPSTPRSGCGSRRAKRCASRSPPADIRRVRNCAPGTMPTARCSSPFRSWPLTPCRSTPRRACGMPIATSRPWKRYAAGSRPAPTPTTIAPPRCCAFAEPIPTHASSCSPNSPPPCERSMRVSPPTAAWPCSPIAAAACRAGGSRAVNCSRSSPRAPARPRRTPHAHRVTMLITTDLLSEGVNLQEANVVVHADLPWSPARAEQRVGRVRRLTSPHDRVFVYAFRPPASADHLLHLERRLRHKIALAARAVGI
ncbi:MAG: helicase-related protein, partial [Gemmatimonadaceae bacterium]